MTGFRIGDRGQRYEVSYLEADGIERKSFGWANTRRGVEGMVRSIELHPTMEEPEVYDRRTGSKVTLDDIPPDPEIITS